MGLDETARENVHIAAHLHDIGKIGVSDRILKKPGKLKPDEMEEMQTHPIIGFTILEKLSVFGRISGIVLHHHERFDGLGYPNGLKGNEIPLESRVIAVADAFDAMTSDRPYRNGMPVEKAFREIRSHAGDQFDPMVVKYFKTAAKPIMDGIKKSSCIFRRHERVEHKDLMHSRAAIPGFALKSLG